MVVRATGNIPDVDFGDANYRVRGDVEMKRTRELTAIHYRRSVKRSASPSIQSVDLQVRCPVCGTRLSADLVKNSGDKKGAQTAQQVPSAVLQKAPDED